MTSPAVVLPPRWLGRGSSRSVSLADVNQAVTGRRLFSQSAKTSSAVPCTGRSGKLRRPGPKACSIQISLSPIRWDKPPTNTRHRMRVWWVEVVGIGPTTGVGSIGHQVPRIFHRFPQHLFIRQTTTSRGQALAGSAPQPLQQNHGAMHAGLVIGIHRGDGKRPPPPASPDTPARVALLTPPARHKPETLAALPVCGPLVGTRSHRRVTS